MSRVCDICHSPDGEHVSVFDDDGATAASACPTCFDALGDAGCCVCGEATSGEYHVARDGRGPDGGPLCGDCRRLWVFDNTPALATRIVRLGISRFADRGDDVDDFDELGNPIPTKNDRCRYCGVRRADSSGDFAIEVVDPFAEVEYLCRRCHDDGRGLK